MRTKFLQNSLYASLLLSVFSLYGCSNEMEVQDDGQKPVLNLTTDHIRSDYGREFKIEGKSQIRVVSDLFVWSVLTCFWIKRLIYFNIILSRNMNIICHMRLPYLKN